MDINKRFLLKVFSLFLFIFIILAPFLYSWAEDLKEKAKEHYRLGEIYYEHGMYKEAEEEFKKALSIMNNLPKEESKPRGARLKKEKQKEGAYIIGIGDVLSISVWENPDLNQEVVVRPDGKISFPLIDEVEAQGLTIPELDDLITQKLKDFIRYPDVSISLKKMGGEKIIVLGQVKKPGVYVLSERKTVLEAIALAGGFTDDAVLSSVVVIRGGFSNPKAERLNLSQFLEKGKFKEDIKLEAQDIVYVPKKFIANLNYFLSQIIGPLSRGTYAKQQIEVWE